MSVENTLPSPEYIVTDRGPAHEVRAFITREGARFELWTRSADAPVNVGKDALVTLARICTLPAGGVR